MRRFSVLIWISFLLWLSPLGFCKTPAFKFPRGSVSQRDLLKSAAFQFDDGRCVLRKSSTESSNAAFPDTLRLLALMVQFQEDDDEETTGDGRFVLQPSNEATIDPPPHDAAYFRNQLEALANYYFQVSDGKLILIGNIHPQTFVVPHPMGYYYFGTHDEESARGATLFFRDAIRQADSAGVWFSSYDCFIVFHAGVGRDINLDVDFTPKDIASLFLNIEDLKKTLPAEDFNSDGISVQGGAFGVPDGLILPETESQEGYELGLLGTAALMFGFQLRLPALWDVDTGRSGIGRWGLMDQGSGNFNGLIPAEPCAFEKVLRGWGNPIELTFGTNLHVACSKVQNQNKIYKVPINDHEYFLIENRIHDPNNDNEAKGWDSEGNEVTFFDTGTVQFSGAPGVIVGVDEYDFGLPGSGILIWHVDEDVVFANLAFNRVNADPKHRGVDLEEADGAQDIGQSYGMFDIGAGSENGVMQDAWYADNDLNKWVNKSDSVAFKSDTHPNSQSYSGANSHIVLSNFSAKDTVMTFSVKNDRIHPKYPVLFQSDGESAHLFWGNFNADQKVELAVAGSGGRIYIWRSDGRPFFNNHPDEFKVLTTGDTIRFPNALFAEAGADLASRPVAGDCNSDGTDEVAAVTVDGRVLIWSGKDANDDGIADLILDKKISNESLTSVLLAQTEGASGSAFIPMLVAGTSQGTVLGIDDTGNILWQTAVSDKPIRGIACYGSGKPDSIFIVSEGHVAMVGLRGLTLFSSPIPEAAADITLPVTAGFDCRLPEEGLLLTNWAFRYFDSEGQTALVTHSTFPNAFSSPAVGDVDSDGDLDIVITGENQVWAFHRNGSLLNHFPVQVADESVDLSDPLLGDVNGDGRIEIVFSTSDRRIEAVGPDGKGIEDFPLPYSGKTAAAPVLMDLDSDGKIELASVSDTGRLDVWDLDGTYNTDSVPWGSPGHDPQGTGRSMQKPQPVQTSNDLMPERLVYNYPNPAPIDGNEFTTIRYRLEKPAKVEIVIYDLAGERIAHFSGPGEAPADNEVVWNLRNVDSGVYFCQVRAEGNGQTKTTTIKIAVAK
jgi:M6 family metalloprotease-like protein